MPRLYFCFAFYRRPHGMSAPRERQTCPMHIFSGGKDSTVLLHIARRIFPDIKAVFSDTGIQTMTRSRLYMTESGRTGIRRRSGCHQERAWAWVRYSIWSMSSTERTSTDMNKINPRRIPRTEADVERAKQLGLKIGQEYATAIFLTVQAIAVCPFHQL